MSDPVARAKLWLEADDGQRADQSVYWHARRAGEGTYGCYYDHRILEKPSREIIEPLVAECERLRAEVEKVRCDGIDYVFVPYKQRDVDVAD